MKRTIFFLAMILVAFGCNKGGEGGKDDPKSKGKDYTNTNTFELVDMGLSVKWATMNLGASASWEVGDYLPWTESTFSMDIPGLGQTVLRVPSQNDWEEFMYNCSKRCIEVNGVRGTRWTSKKNGNAIFLPSAGEFDTYTNSYFKVGQNGMYWTSVFDHNDGYSNYYKIFTDQWIGVDAVGGVVGFSYEVADFARLPIRLVN